MYAPGYPPTAPHQVPSRAWIVSMRVLFCALSVLSIGMLLWAPLLRLAFVRRRAFDWWLSGAGFVVVLGLLLGIGRDNADAHGIDFVLIPLLFIGMLAAPIHYVVADIRHYAQLTNQNAMGGYVPPAPGYGYAATTVPMQTSPAPQPAPQRQSFPPRPYQQPQPPQQSAQPPQQTPPPPQQNPQTPPPSPYPRDHPRTQPKPQRIDQVRAELDELSDYLRKEEGR